MNIPEADRSALGKWEYANYFEVAHNAFEILIDCGQESQSERAPRIYLRIVTSPLAAQQLHDLLVRMLSDYADLLERLRHEQEKE